MKTLNVVTVEMLSRTTVEMQGSENKSEIQNSGKNWLLMRPR